MKKTFLLILIAISGAMGQGYTPVNSNRIQTPALPFLNFDYGARAGAMAGAGVASSPDANAGYLNPSQYVFQRDTLAMVASYTPYARNLINDMNLYGFNGYKLHKGDAFGLSIKYFDGGKVELRDDNGQYLGQASSSEFAVSGNYSKRLSRKNSMGIALSYVYSNLAGRQNMGGVGISPASVVNGSIYYFHNGRIDDRKDSWTNYGASLSNIGSKVSYGDYQKRSFQPTLLKVGLSQNWVIGDNRERVFMLTVDANKLLIPTPPVVDAEGNVLEGKNPEQITGFGTLFQSWGSAPGGFSETLKEISYSFGAEMKFNSTFSLRGGYYTQNKAKGDLHYFTAGLGIRDRRFGLDFSYLIPMSSANPFANMWRVSLFFLPIK